MSTELFEAKSLADEIHEAAGVPERHNPEIYSMTLDMITAAIVHMDKSGMSMSDQRTIMGRRKDELIAELKRLLDDGTLVGEDGTKRRSPAAAPIKIHMSKVQRVPAQ